MEKDRIQPPAVDAIVFVVDAADAIASVNESWDRFALENDAPELTARHVVGRPLWDFVTDPMTRHVYAALLVRVRDGASAQFRYRCDSPTVRRVLELRMSPDDDRRVRFESVAIAVEGREPQPVWDRHRDRQLPLLRVCSWCERVRVDREWLEVEKAMPRLGALETPPAVTHGMCDECAQAMELVIAGLE